MHAPLSMLSRFPEHVLNRLILGLLYLPVTVYCTVHTLQYSYEYCTCTVRYLNRREFYLAF